MYTNWSSPEIDEISRIWPIEHALILRLLAACKRLDWGVWTQPTSGRFRILYHVRRRQPDGWVAVVTADSETLKSIVLRIEQDLQKREAA